MQSCTAHTGSPADHRCDGCSRLLCAECIEEGHRLLTCRHCGEMALPLGEAAVQSAPEYQRAQAWRRPYSLAQALGFVFRGRGLYVFGSYLVALALLALLSLLPVVGIGAGCFSLIFVAFVLFLVPGMMVKIVRDTAQARDELADWPDLLEWGDRLGEVLGFLLCGLLSGLPLVLALKLFGCVEGGTFTGSCWLVLFFGGFLAMAIWIPAFGAVSVSQNNFVALRLDAHLRALVTFGADFWLIVLLATVLIVAGQSLSFLFTGMPLVGLAASAAAGMYGWFTAAHLVGVFFRRNAEPLRQLYREW